MVIHVDPRPEHNLVGRCLYRDRTLLVAPPSFPRPPLGENVGPHCSVPAVLLAGWPEPPVWLVFDQSRQLTVIPKPLLRLSSLVMMRDAVRAGAGAALLPEGLVADDLSNQRLVSWGVATGRSVEVWVLHTSRRLVSPKVAAFVQFLCDAFSERAF